MAAANGTETAAMLGSEEKANQPKRSRSLGPAARLLGSAEAKSSSLKEKKSKDFTLLTQFSYFDIVQFLCYNLYC